MQFFLKRIRDNFSIDLPAYKLTIEAHKTSKRNSFCKCQHRFDSNQISKIREKLMLLQSLLMIKY